MGGRDRLVFARSNDSKKSKIAQLKSGEVRSKADQALGLEKKKKKRRRKLALV